MLVAAWPWQISLIMSTSTREEVIQVNVSNSGSRSRSIIAHVMNVLTALLSVSVVQLFLPSSWTSQEPAAAGLIMAALCIAMTTIWFSIKLVIRRWTKLPVIL